MKLRHSAGQSIYEYALVMGLVLLVSIGAVIALGGNLRNTFSVMLPPRPGASGDGATGSPGRAGSGQPPGNGNLADAPGAKGLPADPGIADELPIILPQPSPGWDSGYVPPPQTSGGNGDTRMAPKPGDGRVGGPGVAGKPGMEPSPGEKPGDDGINACLEAGGAISIEGGRMVCVPSSNDGGYDGYAE